MSLAGGAPRTQRGFVQTPCGVVVAYLGAWGAGGRCMFHTPCLHDGVCPTRASERQALSRGRVRALGSVLGFEEHPEVSAPVVMGLPIFNHPPSGRDLLAHLRPRTIGVGRALAYSSACGQRLLERVPLRCVIFGCNSQTDPSRAILVRPSVALRPGLTPVRLDGSGV